LNEKNYEELGRNLSSSSLDLDMVRKRLQLDKNVILQKCKIKGLFCKVMLWQALFFWSKLRA